MLNRQQIKALYKHSIVHKAQFRIQLNKWQLFDRKQDNSKLQEKFNFTFAPACQCMI